MIDAEGKTLGRLASEVALTDVVIYQYFTPHVDTGDNVIILNASKIHLTVNKLTEQTESRQTSDLGGLKTILLLKCACLC